MSCYMEHLEKMRKRETCKWRTPFQIGDNVKFEVQCNHDPLKSNEVPANFSWQTFIYCPWCGRRIEWV